MTDRHNPHLETAIQALVWAIEEIAKTGNKEAERHARVVLSRATRQLEPPHPLR
jgi:hypothetical protein